MKQRGAEKTICLPALQNFIYNFMIKFFQSTRNLQIIIFLLALASMLGSLYFSEIAWLTPCELCWFQRIVMYPIVALALVGIIRKDKNMPYYVLPLSVIGILISGYHYTIQMVAKWSASVSAVVDAIGTPCRAGSVSCAQIDVVYFGFITIPLMAFAAFCLITIACILLLRQKQVE